MDLADLKDVRRAAKELDDVPKIDHLVAVAGVMVPPYGKTADGFETQFGVNYLANFVLVKELLPKIRAAGAKSSIVICASSAVRGGVVNFDDVNFNVCLPYKRIRTSELTLTCTGRRIVHWPRRLCPVQRRQNHVRQVARREAQGRGHPRL